MRQIVSIQNSIFKSNRKLIFSAFGTILVLVAACFYSKFNVKKNQKLFFPAFGTILVLVAPFFHSKLNLENIENLIFSSFWHDMGFGGSLFLFKIQCKKYSICFFQLLARSWFWWQLLSAKKTKNAKNTKRIPPPNAAIPLVNPILRTSLLYQISAFPSDSDETE